MRVSCRNCDFVGEVTVGFTYSYKKQKVKDHGVKVVRKRFPVESDAGVPATAIPCPQCKQHKLRRIKNVLHT